jgi:hypothetical protein
MQYIFLHIIVYYNIAYNGGNLLITALFLFETRGYNIMLCMVASFSLCMLEDA